MSLNCFPTPQQRLLLQAALHPEPQARSAWQRYTAQVDLQQVDWVSTTFFPLIYRRFEDNLTCKSVYRHTWAQNQSQLFQLKTLLPRFQNEGIVPCLLKGAALIAKYYRDPGLRVMGDIDLLIPRFQIHRAHALLLQEGWHSDISTLPLDRSHALMLKKKGAPSLDLHWHLYADNGLDERLRKASYKTIPLDSQVHTLEAEDQLIHTLSHGLKYSPVPLIRWIPDASQILAKTPSFDWDYFFFQAIQLGWELPLFTALRYLAQESFAPIPSSTLQRIDRHRPTRREKNYFALLTQKPKRILTISQLYWHSHCRNHTSQNRLLLWATLPSYIKKVRNLKSWRQWLPFLIRGAWLHWKNNSQKK